MPSLLHEALVTLFRNRPELAPELLRDALSVELPAYTEVRVESAELSQIVPPGYHADLVVLLIDGRPVLAIVLEVQLGTDERKRFTWPLYVVALRARLECPACVLVVTPYRNVARWAAEPIVMGLGSTFQPLVVGPDGVPMVSDPAVAARNRSWRCFRPWRTAKKSRQPQPRLPSPGWPRVWGWRTSGLCYTRI